MKHFELQSKCNSKHVSLRGFCLVIGVWILVLTGCARAPVPVALELEIEEDTSVSITLTTGKSSNGEVTYQISSLPQHGSISGSPPKIRYTPPTNYFGADEFEYVTVRGNGRLSKPATVKIDIAAVNDPPVAEPMFVTTAVNKVVMISPQAIDVDGPIEEYAIARHPGYGNVEVNGDEFRYIPRTGFLGDDSFEYVAIDNYGLRSANTQVTVRVSLRTQEEVTELQELAASEREDEDTNQESNEAITTEVLDSLASSDLPNNVVPVVEDLKVELLEDSSAQVELKAADEDGEVARFGITTLPAHGTLSGMGATRIYTPSADFSGTDSFAYVAIDDQGGVSTPAVVSIVVDSVNDRPTADSSNWVTLEDSPGIYIDLKAEDPDGEVVTYTVVRSPTNGRVNDVGNGRWLYVPYKDFSGIDSFQWVGIDDEGGRSLEATVTVNVSEQPDPPTVRLRDTYFKTTVDERIDIDVFVSDPENDAYRFEIREIGRTNGNFLPKYGTINELSFLRFEAKRRGTSTYQIDVSDRAGLSAHALFTIEVVNTPPVVELPIPSYDRANGTVNFSVRVRDPDGTIGHFVIQTIDNRRAGSIKVNGTSITDAQSFTTGGACETEDGAWCMLNVTYKPDVIDGHSRRIRVYAVDDEGAASPKDFIRIETRQLRVARYIENEEEDDLWEPRSPRVLLYEPADPATPVAPPTDDDEEVVTPAPVVPPVVVDPEEDDEEDTQERDPDDVIVKRIDDEEVKQVTDPNREVPRDRR